jgi:hypothetical protein
MVKKDNPLSLKLNENDCKKDFSLLKFDFLDSLEDEIS